MVASSDHCHCSRLCSVQASAFQCQINWECFLKVSGCLVPVSSAGYTADSCDAANQDITNQQPGMVTAATHPAQMIHGDLYVVIPESMGILPNSVLWWTSEPALSLMDIKVWVRRSYLSAEAGRRMGAVRRWWGEEGEGLHNRTAPSTGLETGEGNIKTFPVSSQFVSGSAELVWACLGWAGYPHLCNNAGFRRRRCRGAKIRW